ncbi:hypothetical protein GmHk_09G026264 [Glycine max]|nr:hypothetical protein GmHk_09G026264 [Glycine max]
MNRSWIQAPRISDEYEKGVEDFLEFVQQHAPVLGEKYFCPCVNCVNGRRHSLDDIRSHLICDGFSQSYTNWIWHGELPDMSTTADTEAGMEYQKIHKKAQEIQKYNDCPYVLSRGGYELLDKKLMDENRKRRDHLAEFTENPSLSLNPPSPVSRQLKGKMARTNHYGQMTSVAAQEISDKIVSSCVVHLQSLEEHATQRSFVPHGRQDILNTAIGRPEHPGHVRVAGTSVTISQYFGQASRASSTSSPSINQQQLAEIIGCIKDKIRKEVEEEIKQQDEAWRRAIEDQQRRNLEIMKQELKQTLKIELSRIASHQLAPIKAPEIQVLAASVSTKGSCAEPEAQGLPKEPSDVAADLMDLYEKPPPKSVEQPERGTVVAVDDDPLGELVKNLYVVYQQPIEWSWDGAKFGIHNSKNGFFITHADVIEIILGDKCLNISILQLWMMFMNDWSTSIGFAPIYGFLEPRSIHRAKDRRQEYEQYIETWVKESHREVYLGPYLNQAHWQLLVLCPRENIVVWFCSLRKKPDVHIKAAVSNAMKKISTTFQGKENGPTPQWIEPKSNVQAGGYECGYYVMHWMWCIVSDGVKNEWNKWFSDGTPLDSDTMTILRKKWAVYFLQLGKMDVN